MILQNNKNIIFLNNKDMNWKDVIKIAIEPLIKKEAISNNWINKLIEETKKYGFYYVIAENLAFPHISPSIETLKTDYQFLILKNPIDFREGKFLKESIKFVLALSTIGPEEHLEILKDMVQLWNDDKFLKILNETDSQEKIVNIVNYIKEKEEKNND